MYKEYISANKNLFLKYFLNSTKKISGLVKRKGSIKSAPNDESKHLVGKVIDIIGYFGELGWLS